MFQIHVFFEENQEYFDKIRIFSKKNHTFQFFLRKLIEFVPNSCFCSNKIMNISIKFDLFFEKSYFSVFFLQEINRICSKFMFFLDKNHEYFDEYSDEIRIFSKKITLFSFFSRKSIEFVPNSCFFSKKIMNISIKFDLFSEKSNFSAFFFKKSINLFQIHVFFR